MPPKGSTKAKKPETTKNSSGNVAASNQDEGKEVHNPKELRNGTKEQLADSHPVVDSQ